MRSRDSWRRVRPVIYVGLVLLILVVGVPLNWWFKKRAELTPLAIERIELLYEALIAQDYETIENEHLAVDYYFDVLSMRDEVLGPITSYELVEIRHTPTVIPIVIFLTTTRNGEEYQEVAVMSGANGGPIQTQMVDDEISKRVRRESEPARTTDMADTHAPPP